MSNPLLVFWLRLLGQEEDRTSRDVATRNAPVRDDSVRRRLRRRMPVGSAVAASGTIFLVLRRMRAPLIILIVIFAVSVLGLTLVPGQDGEGRPSHMGFFDAFYFMSFTASTIGFGELPYPFTYSQRLWVTISIYLTVIGWAYAIGSLLALLQDRSFRQALAVQHFSRKVSRLTEPFLLFVGYGETGGLLGKSFDALGRRFVVLDIDDERIDELDLDTYHADVPGLAGDGRDPGRLGLAGLGHPCCEGVLALTDDDEANLAVTMTAALLRPEVPVIARTTTTAIAERMHAFGTPTVVNPFDCFGDHLRLALGAPSSYQLMTWLESGPGAAQPVRGRPPSRGRWVVCGYGRLGRELAGDLRAEGLQVTAIEPRGASGDGADRRALEERAPGEWAPEGWAPEEWTQEETVLIGDASDPQVMARADLEHAVGFVAGTDNDTANLSMLAAARRINPHLFLAARQNQPTSAALFEVMDVDALLVPSEVVAHEVYAQLSTPLLWRFLNEVPRRSDEWAAGVVDRLSGLCGERLQSLWKIHMAPDEAPALTSWLASGRARLGDLLRSPDDRDEPLAAVPLLVMRGGDATLAPDGDFVLATGDEILLAGKPTARRLLDATLLVDAVREYVVTGRHVPTSWIWRRLSPATRGAAGRA